MGKIILYIVSIGLILLIGGAIWPYGYKYFISSDLKRAALFGTKHNIEETRILLLKGLKERGLVFDPERLQIDKDENKTVSI